MRLTKIRQLKYLTICRDEAYRLLTIVLRKQANGNIYDLRCASFFKFCFKKFTLKAFTLFIIIKKFKLLDDGTRNCCILLFCSLLLAE